jgi:hypothetical protein
MISGTSIFANLFVFWRILIIIIDELGNIRNEKIRLSMIFFEI